MFANIDGLKIEYTETGIKDGIPVLLLHGWGSSFDVYKSAMAALSDRCRLVALNFISFTRKMAMAHRW